jgi:hypothetical protein
VADLLHFSTSSSSSPSPSLVSWARSSLVRCLNLILGQFPTLTACTSEGAFAWYAVWCLIGWMLVLCFLPEVRPLGTAPKQAPNRSLIPPSSLSSPDQGSLPRGARPSLLGSYPPPCHLPASPGPLLDRQARLPQGRKSKPSCVRSRDPLLTYLTPDGTTRAALPLGERIRGARRGSSSRPRLSRACSELSFTRLFLVY